MSYEDDSYNNQSLKAKFKRLLHSRSHGSSFDIVHFVFEVRSLQNIPKKDSSKLCITFEKDGRMFSTSPRIVNCSTRAINFAESLRFVDKIYKKGKENMPFSYEKAIIKLSARWGHRGGKSIGKTMIDLSEIIKKRNGISFFQGGMDSGLAISISIKYVCQAIFHATENSRMPRIRNILSKIVDKVYSAEQRVLGKNVGLLKSSSEDNRNEDWEYSSRSQTKVDNDSDKTNRNEGNIIKSEHFSPQDKNEDNEIPTDQNLKINESTSAAIQKIPNISKIRRKIRMKNEIMKIAEELKSKREALELGEKSLAELKSKKKLLGDKINACKNEPSDSQKELHEDLIAHMSCKALLNFEVSRLQHEISEKERLLKDIKEDLDED